MDKTWLIRLYQDVGLTAEQADKAAEETRVRLLRRERPKRAEGQKPKSLVANLVRDPLVSLNRIIGRGDSGLPFYDEETRQLSLISFSNLLSEIGLDPVVALAYAKVVIEANDPRDLYRPVWHALGREGEVDLAELQMMDWSPLRTDLPPPPQAQRDTVVARAPSMTRVDIAPTTPATAPPSRTATSAQRRPPPHRPTKAKPSKKS